MAYLRWFLRDSVECFFLAKTGYGYVLLNRDGGQAVLEAIESDDWGSPDVMSLLRWKLPKKVKTAQALVRRNRIGRSSGARLSLLASERLPKGIEYYNVGHLNLNWEVLHSLKVSVHARLNILIHDTIPLEYPEMQRPESVERFKSSLRFVSEYADRVIAISKATRDLLLGHLQRFGRVPSIVVAHPGVDLASPQFAQIPDNIDLSEPYFVTVGTIEPRKSHTLLLEVWQALPETKRPRLLICGQRGWLNQAVFRMLDAGIPDVVEIPDLNDHALAAVVHGAKASLFPSVAEGFGIPPIEAAALGVPVVCSDLPVYRETLGNAAIYLDPQDNYSWTETIKQLMAQDETDREATYSPPSWERHFRVVLGGETGADEE